MICLYCEAPLPHDQAQTCEACETWHHERPPVAGVNHVSQILASLDALRRGDLELDEMEGVLDVFVGLLEAFERKWRPENTPLAAQLSEPLRPFFGSALEGIDEALDEGARALDLLQNLQPEQPLESVLGEAEAALLAFFQGVCAHAAVAMEDLQALNSEL